MKRFSCAFIMDDLWQAKACFIQRTLACETTIAMRADGSLAWHRCTCGVLYCDHILYLAAHTRGILQENEDAAHKRRSHSDILTMLSSYALRGLEDDQPDAGAPDGGVEARPVLRMPGFYTPRMGLDLTVGLNTGRKYVVPDLMEFFRRVQNAETASYGKSLTFRHDMARFSEQSRALLDVLLSQTRAVPSGETRCLYQPPGARTLLLSPDATDALHALYLGQSLSVAGGEDVLFVKTAPPLPVTLTLHKGGWLGVTSAPFSHCMGRARGYLRVSGVMGALEPDALSALAPFLSALNKHDYELIIERADVPVFCQEALPVLRAYTELSGDLDALTSFAPETLTCDTVLVACARDTLRADVQMRYGEHTFNPFSRGRGEPPASVRRDLRAELRIKHVLGKWFHTRVGDELELNGEDAMYAFLTAPDGLAALRELCDVRVPESARGVPRVRQTNARVGVAVRAGDLLEITFELDDFPPDEMRALLAAYREKRPYHRLKNGEFVSLQDGSLCGALEVADSLDLSADALRTGVASVPLNRAAYLDAMLRSQKALRGDRDSAFRKIASAVRAAEDAEFEPPESLKHILREYQVTGYKWLRTLQTYRMAGILADDMGLGKTLEIIAVLLAAFEEGEQRPFLVVCPSSLVLGWDAELRRFAPKLNPRPLLGGAAERRALAQALAPGDVLITSYDQLKRDVDSYQNLEFSYQILDEAQFVKNHLTQGAKSVRLVRARQRFALTGTPIENHLGELWSLFDFLMPGYLRAYARFKQLEAPAAQGDEAARERIRCLTSPFILRRVKQQVLSELPPKTEIVRRVPLEGDQMKLYAATLMEARGKLMEQAGQETQNHIAILALLTRLRQICCHPALCVEGYKGSSAKMDTCMEIVREAVASGHSVLIFSQFTSLLSLLRARLQQENVPFFLLQGDTPKATRASLIARFNDGEAPVFLISLKAGGTGLNLTRADVVIHFDPWWNVAAQNQATDRAHRIGQVNPVQVYKLIARGTLEEKILGLQESKRELAESVLDADTSGGILSMRAEEILTLLDGAST